jgi:hypothetical protein
MVKLSSFFRQFLFALDKLTIEWPSGVLPDDCRVHSLDFYVDNAFMQVLKIC